MKNIRFIYSMALLFTIGLSACEEIDIKPFTADPAVNFEQKSIEYSFITNPNGEFVQEITVKIIGHAENRDRHFSVEVIQDSLTTATAEQYQIMDGIVKAGEFTGTLSVKLFNSEQLDTAKVSLHLKIIDSEDFKAGNIESNDFTVAWTNQVIVPNWRWFAFFFTSKPSTEAYRVFVLSTGMTDFQLTDYRALGPTGAQAKGTLFGDYIKQWNKDNPDNPLRHDDGELAGELIVPIYYTHSKFD